MIYCHIHMTWSAWEAHCNGGRTDGCDISLRLSILSITMAALFPNTPDASIYTLFNSCIKVVGTTTDLVYVYWDYYTQH